MSREAVQVPVLEYRAEKPARTFIYHAKLISGLTLLSRILGVLRESIAARYYGAGPVSNAFTIAFTIPNLFRRLFGEGALSAAFIPLYSQALKEGNAREANQFATASVNLLALVLLIITFVGEIVLWFVARIDMRPERILAVKLTAIMLPYVLLVCGAAFLGAILQVHRRFGLTAASPILLNTCLIGGTLLGAWTWNMATYAGQVRAVFLVSLFVLAAGAVQIIILIPSLREIGFRFNIRAQIWTPAVKRMLKLSIPVAIGAGVLQLSVLIDRGMSFFLAASQDDHGQLITHFHFFGRTFDYPMQLGAAARLAWAQYLYQFPLGVFAIALATAIFPTLSADALEHDREKFRHGLLRGIKVTLWEGLPASIGLIIVAQPAVQVLFQRGAFGPNDTELVAQSVRFYSIAIWAFSLQQIVNRAFYALHDTVTPLIMSIVAIVVEMAIKVPLIFTRLGESGMAAGTAISFIFQSLLMLAILQRKVGSLGLGRIAGYIVKLILASAIMALGCWVIMKAPFFPQDHSRRTALARLILLMVVGGGTYLAACAAMGVSGLEHLIRRKPSAPPS